MEEDSGSKIDGYTLMERVMYRCEVIFVLIEGRMEEVGS